MDAEHRHELKTNELAQFISNAPKLIRENVMPIVGVVLIIAALVTWPTFTRMRTEAETKEKAQGTATMERLGQNKVLAIQGRLQAAELSTSMLLLADSMKKVADGAKTWQVAALALIKRGETLRTDLHYKAAMVDPDVLKNRIEQAKTSYEQAIIKAEGNPEGAVFIAMAQFGLGLCAEEVGDFNEAANIYRMILATVEFKGTIPAAQAKLRLETMADKVASFVFVDAPKAPEMPFPGLEGIPFENIPGAPGGGQTIPFAPKAPDAAAPDVTAPSVPDATPPSEPDATAPAPAETPETPQPEEPGTTDEPKADEPDSN